MGNVIMLLINIANIIKEGYVAQFPRTSMIQG